MPRWNASRAACPNNGACEGSVVLRTGAAIMKSRHSTIAMSVLAAVSGLCAATAARAQGVVLFDFENAPVYTPFPVNIASGGIIAHLSGTGAGYSIQSTSTAPVVPAGFSGHFIYPSSV